MQHRPVVYNHGNGVHTDRPLQVIGLPRNKWGDILKVYPELENVLQHVAARPKVIIHPAEYHTPDTLQAVLHTSTMAAHRFRDRDVAPVTNETTQQLQGFVVVIYRFDAEHVYIYRAGQPRRQATYRVARTPLTERLGLRRRPRR